MGALLYFHVAISLMGIGAGFVVASAMLEAKRLPGWTAVFLITTTLTSLSGFPLPAKHFMPSHAIGILSVIVLAIAIYALYSRRLTGGWRATYVITALLAQYFNVFVLVVQLFQKVPGLKKLAPTQTEPPFAVTQVILLVAFIAIAIACVKRFRPAQS